MARQSPRLQIQVVKNKAVLADQCEVADSYLSRLIGLMGRTTLAMGSGLYFPRCSSVHMWFMRMPIDILFVQAPRPTGERVVTSVHLAVRPWRLFPLFDSRAADCIELPAGAVARCGVERGDLLWFV